MKNILRGKSNMTLQEKLEISMAAKKLIYLLEDCDESDFVDLVISCVESADIESLDIENL